MAKRRIRLLGICGSPREASTAFVIAEALKYAKKEFKANTEYYSLRKKKINFCIHCDYCVRERKCCVYDDAMVEAYDKMEKADALIIGTPVYNGTISGSLKTFLDRCRAMVAISALRQRAARTRGNLLAVMLTPMPVVQTMMPWSTAALETASATAAAKSG